MDAIYASNARAECAPLRLGPGSRAPRPRSGPAPRAVHVRPRPLREAAPSLSRQACSAQSRLGGRTKLCGPLFDSVRLLQQNVFRSLSTHRRSPYHLCLIPPRRRLRRFPHSRPPLHTACARRRRQICSTRSLLRPLSALPWDHEQSISSRYLLIVIPSAVDQQVSTAHRDTACA